MKEIYLRSRFVFTNIYKVVFLLPLLFFFFSLASLLPHPLIPNATFPPKLFNLVGPSWRNTDFASIIHEFKSLNSNLLALFMSEPLPFLNFANVHFFGLLGYFSAA